MSGKVTGRDINGMRAAGWSRPDLSGIKSVRVDKKCSNEQLLAAIQEIVCQSVIQLRGTNADDKYRNIIDMLMLRVRGALADAIAQIEDSNSSQEIDQSEVVQSVSSAVTEMLESKIDPDKGLMLICKDSLKLLADSIVSAISDAITSQDTSQDAEDKNENQLDVAKTAPLGNNVTEKSQSDEKQLHADVIQRDVTDSTNAMQSQLVQPADIEKLKVQLDDSFQKIESLVQNTAVIKQTQDDMSKKDASAVTTPAQTPVEVEKSAKAESDKLQQKTTPKQIKKNDDKGKKSKLQDVLSGKQFNMLMKAIAKYQQKVISCVNDVSESIADMFTKVDKQLSKIHDKLSSNKVSWLAIVAGLSLVLIPLFWDKIKGFFSSLSQKFDLDKMINGAISKVIKTVDWNKHVSVILGKVLTAVLEALSDAVANPFDMITKKFIIAYEAMIEWTNDIWAYVKDELSWTKQKQDENEQKAEQESSQSFSSAMGKLEQHIDQNVKQTEANVNAACDATNSDITQKTSAISEDVSKMQENTTQQITETSQNVNESQSEISNTMLPELSTQLHSSVDNAAQKCDSKADAAITATESKLNAAVEDLDKTMKENGVPTDVDNTTIKQMDAAGEGSQLSNGAIDQPVKGPATVVKTTTEEQGKTVQLYANKSDVKRASEGSEQLQQVAGADGSNVTNITNASSTQATFESKVLVSASGGAAGNEANVYEDMNSMMAEASRSNAAVESSLSNSQKKLDALREKVNEYFSELNSIAKSIQQKQPAQQNNNIVVMSNGQPDGCCMEGV